MNLRKLQQLDFRQRIRLFFLGFFVIVLIFIIFKGLVPFGDIKYTYDFEKSSEFISDLSPESRFERINLGSRNIISAPVYFSLRTPRSFDKARLGLYFNSQNLDSSIIEIGSLVDGTIWRYDLEALENKTLESLCSDWDSIREDSVILCQKEKIYESVEDFLNATSSLSEVAVYNYDLDKEFILNDYESSGEELVYDIPMRSAYQFYTYIKDETLDFAFEFDDLNQNQDPDPIDINLYYNDQLIDVRKIPDDGNSSDDKKVTKDIKQSFRVPNLPEGVYKIELRVNDDIVTRSIKTKQSKVSFLNKMRFFSEEGEGSRLYTDSKKVQINALKPESLQTLSINNQEYEIGETYRQYQFEVLTSSSSLNTIEFAKKGLLLSGEGVFAFATSSLFNPGIKRLDDSYDINDQQIKFVIADYNPVEKRGDWSYKELEIDLTKAYREDRTYGFIISVPGLTLDSSGYLEINRIEFVLEGRNIFQLLKDKLRR